MLPWTLARDHKCRPLFNRPVHQIHASSPTLIDVVVHQVPLLYSSPNVIGPFEEPEVPKFAGHGGLVGHIGDVSYTANGGAEE
jgi:hypothetical protein